MKKITLFLSFSILATAWVCLLIWGPWALDGDRLETLTPGGGAAVNGFRTAVAAIGVGAAALAGLYFTYHSHQLSRSTQYTDRFAKAIEMLAAESEARQLGGIYALERIMKDSEYDRPAIIETLAGFVRIKSPAPDLEDRNSGYIDDRKCPVPESARAAFEVLARRSTNKHDPVINLERCDLRLIYCEDANLEDANLAQSHLGQSHFPRANMRNAYFMGTQLQHTWLPEADLRNAKFPEAELSKCIFSDAILDGANLSVAHGLDAESLSMARSHDGAALPWDIDR
ncbi:pentapeptide repeat-containing protein [Streptomyces sp. 5-6(2022)]|uniref:pentapeptide repeat-containing protein n=1 Tax=Streptomyces sp. 5-6(2022) TaxID=2936510 RepID=UPI0023B9BEE4|nr:pentapeptide repeat-containing protein [Streptomyces sp. 5-6(2022)]